MPDPILGVIPPDPTIYAKIGEVASEWTFIETILSEFLSHMCHADPGAMYVITQTVASASVVTWCRRLVEIQVKDPQSRDVILNLLKEIDAARAERNTIVHGNWEAGDAPGFARVKTFRWDRQEVARDELRSIADFDGFLADLLLLQLQLANLGIKMGFLKLEKP